MNEDTTDPVDPDASLLLEIVDALARRGLLPRELSVGRVSLSGLGPTPAPGRSQAASSTGTSGDRSYAARAVREVSTR